MARASRARVSKSSGQGVSRRSYQVGRSLGNKGTGDPGASVSAKFDGGSDGRRDYGKAKTKAGGEINISYGDTLLPTDLKDLNSVYKDKPKRASLGPVSAKPIR
jgi:hypothetical protein